MQSVEYQCKIELKSVNNAWMKKECKKLSDPSQ